MKYIVFLIASLTTSLTFGGEVGGGSAIQLSQMPNVRVSHEEMYELLTEFKDIDSLTSSDGRNLSVIGKVQFKDSEMGLLTIDEKGQFVRITASSSSEQ